MISVARGASNDPLKIQWRTVRMVSFIPVPTCDAVSGSSQSQQNLRDRSRRVVAGAGAVAGSPEPLVSRLTAVTRRASPVATPVGRRYRVATLTIYRRPRVPFRHNREGGHMP